MDLAHLERVLRLGALETTRGVFPESDTLALNAYTASLSLLMVMQFELALKILLLFFFIKSHVEIQTF